MCARSSLANWRGNSAPNSTFRPTRGSYSVHAANGQRMAVLDDRDAAFAGARQYDLEPQSVH